MDNSFRALPALTESFRKHTETILTQEIYNFELILHSNKTTVEAIFFWILLQVSINYFSFSGKKEIPKTKLNTIIC